MDKNGLSDPYVKMHLLPGASKVNDTPFQVFCIILNQDSYSNGSLITSYNKMSINISVLTDLKQSMINLKCVYL